MIFGTMTRYIDRIALFIIQTLRTLNGPAVIVWTGQLHIIIDNYGIAFFGFLP